jgi:hypothetical protein
MLLIGFGAVVGLWLLWTVVRSRIVEPLRQRDDQIAALAADVAAKERLLNRARRAAEEVEAWRLVALPGDVSLAQTLYLDQLRRTLERSGIERPTIRTSRPIKRGEDYSRIPVGVEARCQLNEITSFLRQLDEAPTLQQIRRLRIQPVVKDGRIEAYDCSLSIEALSMPDALAKDALPTREVAQAVLAKRPPRADHDFQLFAAKNPFQPTEIVDRGQRRDPPDAPRTRDERGDYYLVAAVTVDGHSEVWLRNRSNNARKVVPEGGAIEIDGFQGKVLKVSPDSVLLQVDDRVGPLSIGKNLAAWKPSPSADSDQTPKSSTDDAAKKEAAEKPKDAPSPLED